MKHLLFLFLLPVCAFARPRSGTLQVRLSDNSPVTIEIDGRRFSKVGPRLTVGNLPRGWHRLTVYRYRPYADGKGGHAQIVARESVRIRPDEVTVCTADAGTGRIYTGTLQDAAPVPAVPDAPNTSAPPAAAAPAPESKKMKEVQRQSKELLTDSEKLKLYKDRLADDGLSIAQVRTLAGTFQFEQSKLDLVEWAYSRSPERSSFSRLSDLFTMTDTRQQFKEFLSGH